ncbi:hypothetical protein MNBD_BACTEROID05-1100 [hydrothermal vent metagenome]|uniref:Uncharacterized protein n=1 Tax=hydrothermal vent metagenome TaxID=652676 RepID=A0A3B0TP55_9ZZZZ
MLQYVFTKATGAKDQNENDAGGSTWSGWDPFFEAQGGGTIYNNLFNMTNLIIHSISVTANPMEDVTAKLSLHALFLEREIDNASAFVFRNPTNSSVSLASTQNKAADSTFLGKEIDFNLAYDYTEDVQFGFAMGWFLPGSVFTPAGRSGIGSGSNTDDTAKQAIINVNVAF